MASTRSTDVRTPGIQRDPANLGLSPTRPVAATLAALALVAFLVPLPPPAQAVTCQPAQRGILNANNTFSRGASARHNDYRVICRGDARGRLVTRNDIDTAFGLPNADPHGGSVNRLVLQLANAHLDYHDSEAAGRNIVVLGTVRDISGAGGARVRTGNLRWRRLNVDSHANVQTSNGGRGISVTASEIMNYGSSIRVRNFGSVVTQGGGPAQSYRRGFGVHGFAERGRGDVTVINETRGNVQTRGPAGRGVVAGTTSVAGTSTATNRGTVVTRGNAYFDPTSEFIHSADGVRSWADGAGGIAVSVNDTGGTVDTHGTGAQGVHATNQGGAAAVATNRGRVTTRGNAFIRGSRIVPSTGVRAYSETGVARAVNEARGIVRTSGTGARGLSAYDSSVTGRAEAENRGQIFTSGQTVGGYTATGVFARSEHNTAYVVNHEGARITASGRGGRGVTAYTLGADATETALALNRGSITTTGSSTHGANSVYTVAGVLGISTGMASAVAINAYDGVIESRGAGARGVHAAAWGDGGAASAINQGRITTRGNAYRVDRAGTENDSWRGAHGVIAYSENSDAAVVNKVGGIVETHGAVANGLSAFADGGGSATAVNRGRVITRGAAADDLPGDVGTTFGSRGVLATSDNGSARVENRSTARVDTHGGRAFALVAETGADGSRTSATAEVVNRGQAHTRGLNADGVLAFAFHGGTADNPNRVRATNASGATITTGGTGSSGLGAGIQVRGGGTRDAYGTAFARNDGIVETSGGAVGSRAGIGAANGVAAGFFSLDNTRIRHGADVTLVNSGDVTVKGAQASALYAETFGRGTATVRVLGGDVRAEHATGRGMWVRTGAAGEVDVTISAGAEVAARTAGNTAAQFQGGTTKVRLLDSTLAGRVVFGAGRDTFTIRNGRVAGAIDFGPGADILNVHADTWLERAFRNLENLNKRGRGNLVVRGNATFSPGGRAVVENGGLTFTGQFNLGPRGTMRIHDAARLTAVLANPSAPPRITAGGGLAFDGDEELFVQVAPGVTAQSERTYLGQLTRADVNPIAAVTPVTGRTGQVALRTAYGSSSVVEVGHIPLLINGKPRAAGTVVTAGVRLGVTDLGAPADIVDVRTVPDASTAGLASSVDTWNESELTLGGGVAGLSAALFGVLDAEVPGHAHDEALDGGAPTMHGFRETRSRSGELEYWARSWTGNAPVLSGGVEATLRGYALGVETPLGEGFRVGISTAPTLALSSVSHGQRAVARSRLDGTRYAVRGSWRGEVFHAAVNLSQGRYEAQSVFDNPVAGGGLAGVFDLAQDHAHVGAGARLAWGGMEVKPSLSLLAGVLHNHAYTARGAVFGAEVPAFSQRYHGLKSELTLSPAQWLRGPQSVRWRPALRLHTQHTRTANHGSLEVLQSDETGVLSLTSRARVSGLPRTVHGIGATVDVAHSQDWRLQLGIAGTRTDGETDRAVLARLHVRF